jgi:hypothetical protein
VIFYLESEDESVDVLKIVAQEIDDLVDGLLLRLQVLVKPRGVHHRHLTAQGVER